MPTPTKEQKAWIEDDLGGETLLVAVAGSGKTFCAIEKMKYWVRNGIAPGQIVAATFNSRAGRELRIRAEKAGLPSGIKLCTMHSIGWSIKCDVADLPSSRPSSQRRDVILVDPRHSGNGTEKGRGWWVKSLLRGYLEDAAKGQPEARAEEILDMAGQVMSEASFASSQLIWPDEWTTKDGERFPGYVEWARSRVREPFTPDDDSPEIIEGFYRLYEHCKKNPETYRDDKGQERFPAPDTRSYARPLRGGTRRKRAQRTKVQWVSFDDQIAIPARWIMEGRSFMERFEGAFTHVIIDEAQDNNLAQNVLARFITRKVDGKRNLNWVGDDQQCIYGFRGSRPDLLRDARDAGARQFEMTANFRSAQNILDVGNGILEQAPERLYEGDLMLGRTDPRAKQGTITATAYADVAEEGIGVVDGIVEAIAHGVPLEEIAVIYRLNAQSGPLELQLIKRGIQFRVAGTQFFKRREIATALAWLTVASDHSDEKAWDRVRRAPFRGLGPSFIKNFPSYEAAVGAGRINYKLWRNAMTEIEPRVEALTEILSGEDKGQALRSALQFVFEVEHDEVGVPGFGLREYYRDDSASEEDETEIDTAVGALIECAMGIGSVEALLNFANGDEGKTDSGKNEEDETPRVTLTTAHKAKGLEWGYVAAIGWTKGVFPHFRAPLAEELRLGYVTATRAKDYLHVSWTALDPRGEPAGPSDIVKFGRVVERAAACGPVVWPEATEDAGEPAESAVDELDGFGTMIGAR